MTAPFDIPVPSSTAAPTGTVDYGCCSRAAADAAPPLIGDLALFVERMLEFCVRTARTALLASVRVARRRPWI